MPEQPANPHAWVAITIVPKLLKYLILLAFPASPVYFLHLHRGGDRILSPPASVLSVRPSAATMHHPVSCP